jgi:hypothetical protein
MIPNNPIFVSDQEGKFVREGKLVIEGRRVESIGCVCFGCRWDGLLDRFNYWEVLEWFDYGKGGD